MRPDTAGRSLAAPWWKDAVIYQVYVRSFCDSNGDGVGDIRGVTSKLDYLSWLGVDAIWLSPVTLSADCDWGYDVVDYRAVQPELGTLDDLDQLVQEAGGRGIGVLLDLVPNHTSSEHLWFKEARKSRESGRRDWYVWADPSADGGPPNNWLSMMEGMAWSLDQPTGQYYLHNFLPCQPDLNWWNPNVRDEFERILQFWWDRGVAGFRIDVAHALIKDRLLRDHPPTTSEDHPFDRLHLQRRIYSMNRPEVHEIYRGWRRLADSYSPPRLLLGETFVLDLADFARFYGADDELHLCFNFPFVLAPFSATDLSEIVHGTLRELLDRSTPVWMGSNHDMGRLATRWAEEDERRVRLALLMLFTLPGAVCLYAGDEIGLPEGSVPRERRVDPMGVVAGDEPGRDRMRTPMIWDGGAGHGFTATPERAWLPFGGAPFGTVEDQEKTDDSMLALVRRLIGLRRSWPCLAAGRYAAAFPAERSRGHVWAWRRIADGKGGGPTTEGPRRCVVATNFSPDQQEIELDVREVVLSTAAEGPRKRDSTLRLGPWEGVIALT